MDFTAFKRLHEFKFSGKKVFLRLDLNVPLETEPGSAPQVSDDSRLRAVLPTIQYLVEHGAIVAIASHLGRPQGSPNAKYSLRPVATRLGELLKMPVGFISDCIDPTKRSAMSTPGATKVWVLENTRFYPGEEANDPEFSKQLAAGFDLYINDAFGSLHRAHASTVGMVGLFHEHGIGFLIDKELQALSPLLVAPRRPFVLILGGAKVSDKIGILRHLLPKLAADGKILIGGAMAFTFLKAQGVEIGKSLLQAEKLPQVREILAEAARLGVDLQLPVDFRLEEPVGKVVDAFGANDVGLDIGPRSAENFAQALAGAATIFWNGPLGMFEKEPFMAGTLAVAKAVALSSAQTLIGGGDTLAAFAKLGLTERVHHASTGGGATLEFLEGEQLPGLAALL